MVKIKERFRESLKDNRGFSLTEFIIVIAIIAIMTTASFITMAVMHGAKAKEASSSFENALSEVISLSKNNGVDLNENGVLEASEEKYSIGLKIYKEDGKYYLQKCICQHKDGVYTDSGKTKADPYIKGLNEHSGMGICLSAYVDIKFYDEDGNDMSDDTYILAFDKRGNCRLGYGKYEFRKASNGDKVSTVKVNKNGSYISK